MHCGPGGDSSASLFRGRGRSRHPEGKHETGVLEREEKGKNETNATASLDGGEKTRLHHGAADTEPEGQVHPGASASFGASRNSASPSWMVKIHHAPVSLCTHWRAKGLGARNLCPGHTWARQQDFPEHPDAGASRVFALSGCSGKGHGTPRALKTQGGANKRKSFFPGTAEQARGGKKTKAERS